MIPPGLHHGCVWAPETPVPGLDGTVLKRGSELYFLYAGYGHFPDYGSAIYIMRMSDPYSITGEHVLLTTPPFAGKSKAEWRLMKVRSRCIEMDVFF
jgi:GH43 family beta-xylosidase